MHKSKRAAVKRIRGFEERIQSLAFDKTPGTSKARVAMANNRHWFNRELKGQLRTGNITR